MGLFWLIDIDECSPWPLGIQSRTKTPQFNHRVRQVTAGNAGDAQICCTKHRGYKIMTPAIQWEV